MAGVNDRPITVLDRASVLSATAASRSGGSHPTVLRHASQPETSSTVAPQRTAAGHASPSSSRPAVPRGWGSHEERRIMRWGLVGFFMLAMYAVVFVLLGTLVWS